MNEPATTHAPAEHPLHTIAMQIRYDLTAAQAKLTELIRQIATLDLPTPADSRCPHCQLPTRGPLTLAEHIHVSHNGPVPEHWLRAEAISDEPPLVLAESDPPEKKGDS